MVAVNVERRSMGALGRMGIVAGAHAALILLVGRGLGIVPPLIDDKPPDIFTTVIRETRPVDERPRIADPNLENTIRIPLPEQPDYEVSIENTIVAQPDLPGTIGIDDGDGPGTNAIRDYVGVRLDARHPLSQPRYPSWDTRDGNQGNVDVELYVLPNGRVGDVRILHSSGFERLDQSTIDEAKRNWRLLPATRAGVPFAQWYKMRVTFKLTSR
jgi:protein TonB